MQGLRVNTAKITCEEFEAITPFSMEKIPWIPNGYFLKEESGNYIISVPKTSKNNKLLLCFLPSAVCEKVKVRGNDNSEVSYFDDGKGECGNYIGVNLDDSGIEIDESGNKIIDVEITAPDGVSKDIYKIKVVRKSSGCSLEALTIKGGTVKDLEQSLNSGENSFILELDSDDGEITFDDIQISADATYTIDGTEVEDNTYTVNAGDVTRIEVTAEDGLNSKVDRKSVV